MQQDVRYDASTVAEPPLLGYSVVGADGSPLGVVVLDLRASYPKNRLVIERGAWLWRHRSVVARSHVVATDASSRVLTIDLDHRGFAAMPRWEVDGR